MDPIEVYGDGPGKIARIVISKDGAATQIEARWGLHPFEPDGHHDGKDAPLSRQRGDAPALDQFQLLSHHSLM